MTRCKFRCTKAVEYEENGWSYDFEAVIDGSPENEEFFRWTPGGHLHLDVVRERLFEEGKEYYLDLSPALIEGGSESTP